MTDQTDTTCGFIALVGAPNAGKSTLLNALVGAKVSIVSRKVQTTRARITAIGIEGRSQLVFVDTPGIFAPRRRLDRAMVAAAWTGAEDADEVVLIVDAERGIDADVRRIIDGLLRGERSAILALNKVDLVKRETLLGLAAELNALLPFKATFMISALKKSGVDDLKRDLAGRMKPGPWLYPEDQLADVPERLLSAEITREKLYDRVHQELPYAIHVETESWEEHRDGSVRIGQVIYVERDSQKAIVLGKGGHSIKHIGSEARRDIGELLGRKVHLALFVKVRENWSEDPERYREMGLDYSP
ncbi:GTPase Era [Zavarzinia sp. CC-PAN008]|uniref:GTPase Era n=1 Tax=Zavarzinia sp. CC-PAN008 TaxID=3243332 RepID=UPI003F74450D